MRSPNLLALAISRYRVVVMQTLLMTIKILGVSVDELSLELLLVTLYPVKKILKCITSLTINEYGSRDRPHYHSYRNSRACVQNFLQNSWRMKLEPFSG